MKALEILKRSTHILDASGSEMFTEDEIDLAITELEKLESLFTKLEAPKTYKGCPYLSPETDNNYKFCKKE